MGSRWSESTLLGVGPRPLHQLPPPRTYPTVVGLVRRRPLGAGQQVLGDFAHALSGRMPFDRNENFPIPVPSRLGFRHCSISLYPFQSRGSTGDARPPYRAAPSGHSTARKRTRSIVAAPPPSVRRFHARSFPFLFAPSRLKKHTECTGARGRRLELPRRDSGRQVLLAPAPCIARFRSVFSTPGSRSAAPPWSTGRAAPSTCWRRSPMRRVRMCLRVGCWRWTRPRSRPGARRRARCAKGGCSRCTVMPADEVVFHYAPSRAHRHVHSLLGEYCGTLLRDGYEAYAAYTAQPPGEVTHALCWSHTRRYFVRAKDSDPEAAAEALALIGTMYAHEKQIRGDGLTGDEKWAYRQTNTRPFVETLWRWCRAQCHRPELLPKRPLEKALNNAQERRSGLEIFFDDPAVDMDTNHVERTRRPVPLGKRNSLFTSSEAGAQRVGIIQSLLVTCGLHKVDAYTYPGQCAPTNQRASGQPRHRAHPADVEVAVRR